ncbi:MAG: long-chain fatty acid--CoA ligase, partial [Gammaproteobacteria bacterium]|nr:long-chain fatty acid--CoA ligase [Gammaproteobacteria bacterium]NIR85954.1 long-chain fatty acid--CoA ligase [Gammaproteobacteria bacterium]NIU06406.1 long-chain fatty acid--CoA ligase [Gammaproteobacteria bacterium]NIV53300.1 hypothetical protein [Gammaproteobacteria bacterium]NIV76957.1 hypothetical protein [Gammaproteobacteria bacterium]
DLEAQQVQAHCRNQLALYKVPRYVEFRDELPRTASGKIQRHLLREEPKNDERRAI